LTTSTSSVRHHARLSSDANAGTTLPIFMRSGCGCTTLEFAKH
jgi:hypothetical protein